MSYLHISKGSGKMLGLDSLNTDTTSIDFCNAMFNSKNPNIICSIKKIKGAIAKGCSEHLEKIVFLYLKEI